jgi:NAD(P)-dependent dehydrogenase (short-subunit alcohol dehydrogenase family)
LKQVHKQLGRIDVAINNAGYGLFGAIEEVSEQEARAQIETNLFGALWVTQAVLPIMRAQQSGHIIQISSIGGVWTVPTGGLYHASKWGLEGFSQALAAEAKPFGIKVTTIEPGGFATEFSATSAHRAHRNHSRRSQSDCIRAVPNRRRRRAPAACVLRRLLPPDDQARICRAHRDLGKVERCVAGSARQSRQSLRRHLTETN